MTEKNTKNKGAMSFGLEVLLFVVAVFILWVLTGGQKNQSAQKPFIKPLVNEANPGQVYGQNEK
jgi:hypothetical protein